MWHFASRGSVSQILINIGSWGPPVKFCWGQSLAIINVLACLNLNCGKKNRIESLEPVSAGDNLFIFHSKFKRLLVSNNCLFKYCLGVLLGISIVHYEREIHPELVYAELGQREREAHFSLYLTKYPNISPSMVPIIRNFLLSCFWFMIKTDFRANIFWMS